MDFAQALRVILRRWPILVIGTLLSAGAAIGAYTVTSRSYEATSQVMLLLPPTANNAAIATSPFLFLPNGLNTLARVVALAPNTPEFRADMAQGGYDTTYLVSVQLQVPIIAFSVEGANPESILGTRDELMSRVAVELDRVQRDESVPVRQWAHTRVLEASGVVTASSGDRIQSAAAAGVAGALLTMVTIALVEGWSRRRSRRLSGALAAAEDLEVSEGEEAAQTAESRETADDSPTGVPDSVSDGDGPASESNPQDDAPSKGASRAFSRRRR